MKCKFEHGDDCCNCGSPQYMCKCKPETCGSAAPMTNAARTRTMSDEELAAQMVVKVDGLMECSLFLSLPTGKFFVSRSEAERVTLEWLQQPAEADD